jgi:aspartate ammonia-lyase
MNVNEVIANRAEEMLGGKRGQYKIVHPNNHVNMSQSSNNVVPSAIKIVAMRICARTAGEAKQLQASFGRLASKNEKVMKIGRTHLQDAVPMTYGQAFAAYGRAIEKDIAELERATGGLGEIGVGGTATGSGITAHPKFRQLVAEKIRKEGKIDVVAAKDCIEITQDMNDFLSVSGALRRYAVTLGRISNDLRLLASGPKAGIAEIILPEVEPGSSIMPGKINPSIPEAVNMACYQAMANDQAVMLAAQSGQLELNFATPLIAHNIFQAAEMLENATAMMREHCVEGLKVDTARTRENFERSFGYATALNPYLGYKEVSLLVKEAYAKGVSLRELVLHKGILGQKDLDAVIASATGPSEIDKGILRRVRKP